MTNVEELMGTKVSWKERYTNHIRTNDTIVFARVTMFLAFTVAALVGIVYIENWLVKIALAFVLGAIQINWYETVHWCVHRTLFVKQNRHSTFGPIFGFFGFRSYLYERANHLQHHYALGDPDRDPERMTGCFVQISKSTPIGRIFVLIYGALVGVINGILRVFMTALLGNEWWRKFFMPFVKPKDYRGIVREARSYAVGYILVCAFVVLQGAALTILLWLVAMFSYNIFAITFATPEHEGLYKRPVDSVRNDAEVGEMMDAYHRRDYIDSMLSMTRLFQTNFIVRNLRWNENFHAAHHAFPNIPYYLLPEVSKDLGEKVVHRKASYFSFLINGEGA